jgi:hypothetical protein
MIDHSVEWETGRFNIFALKDNGSPELTRLNISGDSTLEELLEGIFTELGMDSTTARIFTMSSDQAKSWIRGGGFVSDEVYSMAWCPRSIPNIGSNTSWKTLKVLQALDLDMDTDPLTWQVNLLVVTSFIHLTQSTDVSSRTIEFTYFLVTPLGIYPNTVQISVSADYGIFMQTLIDHCPRGVDPILEDWIVTVMSDGYVHPLYLPRIYLLPPKCFGPLTFYLMYDSVEPDGPGLILPQLYWGDHHKFVNIRTWWVATGCKDKIMVFIPCVKIKIDPDREDKVHLSRAVAHGIYKKEKMGSVMGTSDMIQAGRMELRPACVNNAQIAVGQTYILEYVMRRRKSLNYSI